MNIFSFLSGVSGGLWLSAFLVDEMFLAILGFGPAAVVAIFMWRLRKAKTEGES